MGGPGKLNVFAFRLLSLDHWWFYVLRSKALQIPVRTASEGCFIMTVGSARESILLLVSNCIAGMFLRFLQLGYD